MASRRFGLIAFISALVVGGFWLPSTSPRGMADSPAVGGRLGPSALGPTAPADEDENLCYGFTTIAWGAISGVGDFCAALDGPLTTHPPAQEPPCVAPVSTPQVEVIIRNPCAWEEFWSEHVSWHFPQPPAPEVDFDRFVVAAVVLGSRPTSCYGLAITRISGDQDSRKIHVREFIPCEDSVCGQIITNPFHFVQVCRELLPFEAPIAFEHRDEEGDCERTVECSDAQADGR